MSTVMTEHAFTCLACSPDGAGLEAWLKDKIAFYATEAARLERELTHLKILLKGHQTWLSDVERRKAGQQ